MKTLIPTKFSKVNLRALIKHKPYHVIHVRNGITDDALMQGYVISEMGEEMGVTHVYLPTLSQIVKNPDGWILDDLFWNKAGEIDMAHYINEHNIETIPTPVYFSPQPSTIDWEEAVNKFTISSKTYEWNVLGFKDFLKDNYPFVPSQQKEEDKSVEQMSIELFLKNLHCDFLNTAQSRHWEISLKRFKEWFDSILPVSSPSVNVSDEEIDEILNEFSVGKTSDTVIRYRLRKLFNSLISK